MHTLAQGPTVGNRYSCEHAPVMQCLNRLSATAMQVQPTDLQPLTFASHTYETFHLLMPLYGESLA